MKNLWSLKKRKYLSGDLSKPLQALAHLPSSGSIISCVLLGISDHTLGFSSFNNLAPSLSQCPWKNEGGRLFGKVDFSIDFI